MPDRNRFYLIVLLSVTAGCLSLLFPWRSGAQDLASLASAIPRRVATFAADGPDGLYDRRTIFDYIDGGAEVYLAYDMRGSMSRRYAARGEPAIVIDLFDMGTSTDAFGVFTHDREGDPVDVGEDGLNRDGWIRFWKGRFFVSIYTERETAGTREASFRLARSVEAGIREKGERPRIMRMLPQDGLLFQSVRYLHSHILLETHVHLSDENILGLGPDTEVLLASFVRDGKRARLLIVSYPDEEKAAAAGERYRLLRPDAGSAKEAIASEDGKWSGLVQVEGILAIVLDAENGLLAENLLGEVKGLR